MRIIQILPTLVRGDAVGNNALLLHRIFEEEGYCSRIYAENFGPDTSLPGVFPASVIPDDFGKTDILIYHLATAWDFIYHIERYSCKKVMIYHNVTPVDFFIPYNRDASNLVLTARRQMHYLSNSFDYCLADSEYNKQELIDAGYSCEIDVMPIFIPFEDYQKTPDVKTIQKYSDSKVNFLFVGRIAPNKKQENIIAAFYLYKKYFNSKARLILIGGDGGFENYKYQLRQYIHKLGLGKDVVFPGHISFAEILAFYTVSHLFVSMSEHEGFGVPLIEAMAFDLPIIAYASSAVPETLGDGGFLVEEKNPLEIAAIANEILTNDHLRAFYAEKQKQILEKMESKRLRSLLKMYLQKIEAMERAE